MPKLIPEDLLKVSRVVDAVMPEENKLKLAKDLQSDLQIKLVKNKMSTDSCLEVVSDIMHTSRKEVMRLQAAKLGLELNGVLTKEEKVEEKKLPSINFIFQDSNVQLNGIFCPKRENSVESH